VNIVTFLQIQYYSLTFKILALFFSVLIIMNIEMRVMIMITIMIIHIHMHTHTRTHIDTI